MTISTTGCLPISANVPIYLTNSLQIFAPFNGHRKRRRLAPWRIPGGRSLGMFWKMEWEKPSNEMVDEGLMNGDLTTIKGFDAPQQQ